MQTPDITSVQIAAFLTWAISLVTAFGLSLTTAQQTAIVGGATFFAAAIVWADAHIRHGRATGNITPPVADPIPAPVAAPVGQAVPVGVPAPAPVAVPDAAPAAPEAFAAPLVQDGTTPAP